MNGIPIPEILIGNSFEMTVSRRSLGEFVLDQHSEPNVFVRKVSAATGRANALNQKCCAVIGARAVDSPSIKSMRIYRATTNEDFESAERLADFPVQIGHPTNLFTIPPSVGVWVYWLTFVADDGRESDPSPTLFIDAAEYPWPFWPNTTLTSLIVTIV